MAVRALRRQNQAWHVAHSATPLAAAAATAHTPLPIAAARYAVPAAAASAQPTLSVTTPRPPPSGGTTTRAADGAHGGPSPMEPSPASSAGLMPSRFGGSPRQHSEDSHTGGCQCVIS
mmetsp:Transcript_3607/g.9410  ORF Transcript_3607/g.9410 Transcript_3607/m.9410 type:complete len:118 (+) Transcript_3607:284-637(+)